VGLLLHYLLSGVDGAQVQDKATAAKAGPAKAAGPKKSAAPKTGASRRKAAAGQVEQA
jgi:hypothetical protein